MSPGSSTYSSSGSKFARIFSGTPSLQRQVVLPADAPAPPALRLQQEHVVAVEMRADAAAVAGIADHQVVQPRVGHEAKLLQQRMRAGRHAGPRPAPAGSSPAVTAAAARGAGTGPRRSASASALRATRRDSTSSRAARANSSLRGEQRLQAGHGAAHQQRLLLPVPPHELRGVRPPSRGEGCVMSIGPVRQLSYGNHTTMRGRA